MAQPTETVECTISNDIVTYNLYPLSLLDKNYIIENGDKKFIINVCRPVVLTEDTLCPSKAGICMENLTEPNLKYR